MTHPHGAFRFPEAHAARKPTPSHLRAEARPDAVAAVIPPRVVGGRVPGRQGVPRVARSPWVLGVQAGPHGRESRRGVSPMAPAFRLCGHPAGPCGWRATGAHSIFCREEGHDARSAPRGERAHRRSRGRHRSALQLRRGRLPGGESSGHVRGLRREGRARSRAPAVSRHVPSAVVVVLVVGALALLPGEQVNDDVSCDCLTAAVLVRVLRRRSLDRCVIRHAGKLLAQIGRGLSGSLGDHSRTLACCLCMRRSSPCAPFTASRAVRGRQAARGREEQAILLPSPLGQGRSRQGPGPRAHQAERLAPELGRVRRSCPSHHRSFFGHSPERVAVSTSPGQLQLHPRPAGSPSRSSTTTATRC